MSALYIRVHKNELVFYIEHDTLLDYFTRIYGYEHSFISVTWSIHTKLNLGFIKYVFYLYQKSTRILVSNIFKTKYLSFGRFYKIVHFKPHKWFWSSLITILYCIWQYSILMSHPCKLVWSNATNCPPIMWLFNCHA